MFGNGHYISSDGTVYEGDFINNNFITRSQLHI